MSSIHPIFDIAASPASRGDVIRWWESRRVAYNLVLLVIGVVAVVAVVGLGGYLVKPGVDFEEPLGILFGVPLYAIVANVCYTFGWIVELWMIGSNLGRHRTLGPRLFKAGFVFSCFLTSLPIWWVLFLLATTAPHSLD